MMAESRYSLHSANISLIDACRRAGLGTAGSGYKIWATQQDFRDDLLRHALTMESIRAQASQRLLDAVEQLGPDPSLSDLIRVGSIQNVEATVGADWFNQMIALWLAAATDEAMRVEQLERQRAVIEVFRRMFEDLLAVYGREMRSPFTVEMLALAVAAQVCGIGHYCAYDDDPEVSRVQRPSATGEGTDEWHLLGCVTEALVDSFTRPIAEPA